MIRHHLIVLQALKQQLLPISVVLMTVHLTNLRGKVFKSGAMQRVFLKVMVMTISNQQVNQTTLLTLIQQFQVVTT